MCQLNIDLNEVSRYLGFGASPPDEETQADIHLAVEELRRVATPRNTHQVFSLVKTDNISLSNTNLTLQGDDIRTLLTDSTQCILMAVTLGQGVDALIRRLQITSLSHALVVDVCASSMIEQLCNQLDDSIRQQWRSQEKFLTDRFSPGYGDLPLSIQPALCAVLNTQKTIGLAVTSTGIMIPRKSITAVLGISDQKQKATLRGCAHCDLASDCPYRKGGTTCAT